MLASRSRDLNRVPSQSDSELEHLRSQRVERAFEGSTNVRSQSRFPPVVGYLVVTDEMARQEFS
jgi:hypothetical protein